MQQWHHDDATWWWCNNNMTWCCHLLLVETPVHVICFIQHLLTCIDWPTSMLCCVVLLFSSMLLRNDPTPPQCNVMMMQWWHNDNVVWCDAKQGPKNAHPFYQLCSYNVYYFNCTFSLISIGLLSHFKILRFWSRLCITTSPVESRQAQTCNYGSGAVGTGQDRGRITQEVHCPSDPGPEGLLRVGSGHDFCWWSKPWYDCEIGGTRLGRHSAFDVNNNNYHQTSSDRQWE